MKMYGKHYFRWCGRQARVSRAPLSSMPKHWPDFAKAAFMDGYYNA